MSISIPTAFKTRIDIPFGQLKSIIEWCTDNCIDDWRFNTENSVDTYTHSYDFYFESERDFVAFIVWKK